MFQIYINTVLSGTCDNWKRIKLEMVNRNLSHVFVVRGADQWNVVMRNGRMVRSKV